MPFGEAAVLVDFASAEADSLAVNARVHALARAIDASDTLGIENLTPGVSSLLIEFDPLRVDARELGVALQGLVERARDAPRRVGRLRHVPVVYGDEYGPDLDWVSARLGLTPTAVVERHSAFEHSVYVIGFAPGFPYLGDLPPELTLPRRETPRESVPAGSVAIAGRQTGIYPRSTPGGWHVIGRTPITLFAAQRDPPAYLAPGDRVRLVPIAESEWDRHLGEPADW